MLHKSSNLLDIWNEICTNAHHTLLYIHVYVWIQLYLKLITLIIRNSLHVKIYLVFFISEQYLVFHKCNVIDKSLMGFIKQNILMILIKIYFLTRKLKSNVYR